MTWIFQCQVLLNLCWIICILLKQTAIHHVHVFRHIWPEEQGTQCTVLSLIPGGCMTRLWTSSSNRVTRRLSWIITPSVSTSWASACEQYPLLNPLWSLRRCYDHSGNRLRVHYKRCALLICSLPGVGSRRRLSKVNSSLGMTSNKPVC